MVWVGPDKGPGRMGKVTLRDLLTWEKGRNVSAECRVNESLHSTEEIVCACPMRERERMNS